MDEHTALTGGNAPPGRLQRFQQWCASILTLENRLLWVTSLWGFLTGVERAIIMPTLWLYFLRYFNRQAGVQYYGITSAAFNFSILVFSPIYGFLAYRGVNSKLLIIVSNQLEVIGNIIYFLASEPWLVMVGRFVAGIGGGSEVPLYANIMRGMKSDVRTRTIVTLLLWRQFGLIVGPACTIFMHPIQFDVGKRHFDVYNLPGVFMVILWTLHTAITIAIYPSTVPLCESTKENQEKENDEPENEEADELTSEKDSESDEKKSFFANIRNTYLNTPTIALFVTVFGAYMSVMALEAVLPPVSATYFQWSDLETSSVYIACGFTVIIVFVVIRLLTGRFQERQFLFVSLVELCLVYAYLVIVTVLMSKTQPALYITLILLGILGHVIGIPFTISFCESLFIRRAPDADMDRAQSIFRTVFNVAILVGPFLGGSLQNWPWSVFLVMFVHILTAFCLISASYKSYEPEEAKS